MAQSLDSIIGELNAAYDPSRKTINDRINSLQGSQDADIAGLQGQQAQAFDDITAGARSRGVGFSGIPLQEQAKYTAGTFLPAVAKVKQSYNDSRNSLTDALNSLNADQYKTALATRQTQQTQDFQAQQAALDRAASAASAAAANRVITPNLGSVSTPSATAVQRADKGYNYTDANGRAISAAQYAQLKGIPFRDVLQAAANSGDNGSRLALDYVGNDYGVNKQKLSLGKTLNPQINNILNSILSGVNKV